jgi:hypothetical protein
MGGAMDGVDVEDNHLARLQLDIYGLYLERRDCGGRSCPCGMRAGYHPEAAVPGRAFRSGDPHAGGRERLDRPDVVQPIDCRAVVLLPLGLDPLTIRVVIASFVKWRRILRPGNAPNG